MALYHYRFESTWSVAAATSDVFAAVVDLAGYPTWWPDVRSVTRIDDDTAELVCRATLPYTLRFTMRRAEQDEPSGRMRVTLSGDLVGTLSGAVTPNGAGSRLVIVEQVAVATPLLRALTPLARPLLRANHAAMMRRGQRGLRNFLG